MSDDPHTKMLSEIAIKVGKLETLQETNAKAIGNMADSVNRLVDKLDKSDDVAKEALQSSRSAHHRINEMRSGQHWMIGTTLTVVALFFTAVGLLWKWVSGS